MHFSDVVVFFDNNESVKYMNPKALVYFDLNKENYLEVKLEDSFKDFQPQKNQLREFLQGKEESFSIDIMKKGKEEILQCRFIKIFDKFNDYSGLLLIAKEFHGLRGFKEMYSLSKREIEITHHVISGMATKEISENLEITSRTVKSHITNIYNKCGIHNRIGLLKKVEEQFPKDN